MRRDSANARDRHGATEQDPAARLWSAARVQRPGRAASARVPDRPAAPDWRTGATRPRPAMAPLLAAGPAAALRRDGANARPLTWPDPRGPRRGRSAPPV